jgi:hypothetical protein
MHDPQASEFPTFWTLNVGMRGPSVWSFSTIVPEWPVARSVTLMCHPSLAGVTKKCTVMVSPACMTSGVRAAHGPLSCPAWAASWNRCVRARLAGRHKPAEHRPGDLSRERYSVIPGSM